MGTANLGDQKITFSYGERAESQIFNSLLHKVLPTGIYEGGSLAMASPTSVTIDPFTAIVSDTVSEVTLRLETTTSYTLVGATPTTPYLAVSFTWVNSTVSNYADIGWRSLGGVGADDVILGKANFSGSVLDGTFDYSDRMDVALNQTAVWSSSVYYSQDAIVLYGGQIYVSKVDNNYNNIPPTFPTYEDSYWINIFGPAHTSTNYVSDSSTITGNLSALDTQVETNASDLSSATASATSNELVRRDANGNAYFSAVNESVLEFDTATNIAYTLLTTDKNVIAVDTTTADFTLTLPDLASNVGRKLYLINVTGTNDLIYQRAGSDVIGSGGDISGTVDFTATTTILIAHSSYWEKVSTGGGGGSTVTLVAAESLSLGNVIAVDASGKAIVASKDDDTKVEVAGLAIDAALVTESIVVQKIGRLTGLSSLTSGVPCFLGNNGAITQDTTSIADFEYRVYLGTALSATDIDIQIGEATLQTGLPIVIGEGTSFPASALIGEEFYRTDLDEWYKYSTGDVWVQI